MARFIQALARASWSRGVQPAVAVAFIAFASLCSFAAEEEITFRGQQIYTEGLSAKVWVGDPEASDAELILIYSNAAPGAVNTLRTDRSIEARMLLVGGGGAGGYGSTSANYPGGGGGGGQVLDLENSGYGAGKYVITVGAGGGQTTTQKNGENGQPSFITLDGLVITNALGGGGGGAKNDGNGGNDVATGGGGAPITTTSFGKGGLGTCSSGGDAKSANRSGGGGGAGANGMDSTTGTDAKSGDGGAGISSGIWPGGDGNPQSYGGGGGGGQTSDDTRDFAGAGVDGGGHGGYRYNRGEDGKNGTGGGGGGGGRDSGTNPGKFGGAGGSGIVIIRLTYIEQPMEWKAIEIKIDGQTTDGKVFVDVNAVSEWVGNDLIITYSNVTARGGLRFFDPDQPELPPVWAKAHILAVGGGGGGGMIDQRGGGAGAGGGAGGFLEEGGFLFSTNYVYSVVVGAGGKGGSSNEKAGESGGNSSVSIDGGGLVMSAEAKGGGGGGAHSAGLPGGSGGGGSRDADGNVKDGGDGTAGQGFGGGTGGATYGGAGGGGAGGRGEDVSGVQAGAGGAGTNSWITGTEVWYAGGGGGAAISSAESDTNLGGAGGIGGGGNGAGVTNNVAQPAQNGVDGLGGGGGGGISYVGATNETAGCGGNGIVIIRLSGFVVKCVPPPVTTDFTYDGAEHRGVAEFPAYTLSGDLVGSNVNVYAVTATIAEDVPYEWWDGGRGDRTVHWKITQAENEMRDFFYPCQRLDRLPDPLDSFKSDWPKRDDMVIGVNVIVEVRPEGGGEGDWKSWGKPEEKGNYEIRITIPEDPVNGNWKGAGPVQMPFGTWKELSDLFTDRMEVTVSGNTSGSTALNDFPVPVRVREPEKDGYSAYSGFEYARAGSDGTMIRFFDSNGDPVEHDVDTWNTHGESLVWVRVPTLTSTTTKLTMCWRRTGSIRIPDNDGTKVWSDYLGVWHLSKPENGKFADASGNGLDAVVPAGSSVEIVDGKFGKAAYVTGGNLMAPDYQPLMPSDTNGFTYTGWYLGKDYASGNYMFAGKKPVASTTYASGWCFNIYSSVTAFRPYLSGSTYMSSKTVRDVRSNWNFFGLKMPIVGTNTTAYCYYSSSSSDVFTEATTASQQVLTNNVPLLLARQGFQADELRLSKVARTKEWLNAEWASLNKGAAFCTYGLVIREDQLCDWWATSPSITPQVSKMGTPPTVDKGRYSPAAGGGGDTAVTGTYRMMPDGEWQPMPIPSDITNGYYQAMFDHTSASGKVDGVWYEYRPQAHITDFYIIEKKDPTHDLGGFGGDSGRILLMNADNRTEYAVTNQGWCARSGKDTVTDGVTCWWITAGDEHDGTNNIMGGTSFELVRCADTNVLWTLTECRQGNTFPTNEAEQLSADFCYLPSGNSGLAPLSITNENVAATQRGDAGWVMMRNSIGAEISSSWFTNGIGTIYFDAVNSRKSVAENIDGYKLVLEIDRYTDTWERVTMYPTVVHGTTYTDQPATDELALGETAGGNRDHYFYRVHAPVVEYRPVRFRIRRISKDETASGADDGFILMDNIIASVPPVSATLKPYGHFDPTLKGDTAVGVGGAFAVPFPSVGNHEFPGRCKVELPPGTSYAGKPVSEYISMAQMFYRWRYLGQAEDWRMAVLEGVGTDAMATAANLDVLGRPGDLEFYFVSMMKSDYYGYVDYSRKEASGKVSGAGYTEEITKKVSAMDPSEYGVTRLASGGTDWFVRIRDGASDWEGMTLELRGAVSNDCPMRLVEDGGWRGLFAIPTNAEGRCTFQFRGRNRQTVGSTDYAFNATMWGGGSEEVELPRNGILSVGGAATPFTLDHVANYLEFRIGADASANPTWSASRAEYQNFNNWHDVWSSPESQKFAKGTNGVDDVSMRTENLDMTTWNLYRFEDSAWDETFYLVNYNDPGFPKEQFFQNHGTPSVWNGYNLTFVSKYLAAWVSPSAADKYSGMAAKLQGQGGGILEYNKSNNPKGLENIRFTARIGQSIGFDGISHAADKSAKQNYTFLCPVSMSRSISDDAQTGDMSVGGAISLFAYYRESKGCYEFRATRAASGKEVLLELFKWHYVNGAMQQDRLCGQRFSEAPNNLLLWDDSGKTLDPKYFGMFISVENTSASTKIIGGVWKGNGDKGKGAPADSSFNKDEAANGYGGLVYEDKDEPFTSGSYGVAAKDCPAEFIRPRHIDAPVDATILKPTKLPTTTTYPGGQYFNPANNQNFTVFDLSFPVSDIDDIAAGRWELGQQIEKCANGLRTPVGLSQDVVVMLQPKTGGDWLEAGRITVSGYALAERVIPVHLTGDWNMRLTTGENAVDIVIGEVRQRQWQGVDYENLSNGSDEFVYTQGVVESNTLSRAKETLLQPSRGVVTKPLSVRSPVLHGLGKVSFAYEDADPNAEVWVQVATNSVEHRPTDYNLSVKSVERGKPEAVGEWITVAKFGEDPETCPDGSLGRSGVKTVYLGWHDQASAPVTGIFRVFIPTNVVSKAIVLATNSTQNVDYGRISVTGMTVTDEPGISERSWRGWNLRTIGDDADTEQRMFLDDGLIAADVGYGLTCGLNNSVNDVVDDDIATVSRQNPAIWSPTLEQVDGKSRSIGSVSFRARLYHPGDARETEVGGVISIYGATSSVADDWRKLVDIPVTSSTFSNFTWKALGETRYRAVKVEVSGNAAKTKTPDRDRVIIDEIVLTEKLDAKIGFEYVRPFRTNLYEPVVIEDIESPNEQPLVGESWGVQTKLRLEQLGREVSGLEVCLKTFEGESPWGYGKWKESAPERPLVPVGDPKDGIYRSVGTSAESLVQPVSKSSVVQYMVILRYKGEGEEIAVQRVEKDDWAQPSWYWPVDYNEQYGGNTDPDKFSPYTILDTVSPGRAWINEVNWNDGPPAETHTDDIVKTNQFVEICVPSGMDMTDWYIRATDLNGTKWVMAKFGTGGVRSNKVTEFAVNNFEFMLLESPETNLAGGIRDAEGNPVETDGTWSIAGIPSTADKGSLAFNRPWQFELVRPSGIVEHQVVIGGTNTLSGKSYGYIYDATNLLAKLNGEEPSPKRFLAGDELARSADRRSFASFGVIGGAADGNPAPGGEGTWTAPMRFTPGRLNEGQEIPAGWYLAPNGTNSWVTLTVIGDFLTQEVGGESAKVMRLVVPKGSETNVTYRTKPWYELDTLAVDGRTVAEHQARGGATWTYTLVPTGLTCNVVATEGFDSGLDKYGLRGHPYGSAVTRWLSENYAEASAEEIQLAAYKGPGEYDRAFTLGLVDMYWLDIPPVPLNDAERDNVAAGNTNWWLRGGVIGLRPDAYKRTAHYAAGDIVFTNSQVDLQLYISNSVSCVAYAPQYLQGINNEKSNEYGGTWVSETLQILGNLKLAPDPERRQGFMPFRSFKLNEGSFTGAEAAKPFTSTIEITDPFSTESPGYSYGWSAHKGEGFYFTWTISTNAAPLTIQTLKANDTYGPD